MHYENGGLVQVVILNTGSTSTLGLEAFIRDDLTQSICDGSPLEVLSLYLRTLK